MEGNNNKTTFSLNKKKLMCTMRMTKCCIKGCPAITNSLIRFPPKHTEEYTFWLRACKESEANIIFKQNPLICALHFRSMNQIPVRYVTGKDIEVLNEDLDRVNHCVAEWLFFMRNNSPDVVIDDKDVYSKAKEIGRVYQQPHFEFDIDFGWINIFESYLHSKGIKSWNPNKRNIHPIDCSEEFMKEDGVRVAEESIKSYDEALRRVSILYSYCKRTENKSALEIIKRLNNVLKKRV